MELDAETRKICVNAVKSAVCQKLVSRKCSQRLQLRRNVMPFAALRPNGAVTPLGSADVPVPDGPSRALEVMP